VKLDVCVRFRKNIFMPMTAEEITRRIQTALPDANITLEDLAGDNDHWKVIVTSAAFAGKSRIQQHQMVYAAFGKDMGTTLHALAVETRSQMV
jgi:stress-induced morphogen